MKNKNKINNRYIPDFLTGTFEEFRKYTRYYAKSFYFSSFALPAEKRKAAYAVYAFCRYADNITDVSGPETDKFVNKKIDHLLAVLEEIYNNKDITSDFAGTIRKYKIPESYFRELVEGISSDINKKSYDTYAELEVYCYKVASVVGLIMTRIFGSSGNPEPYAIALGKAMQLTNILRDIKDDNAMGRVYLAREDIYSYGCNEKDISKGVINDNFKNLMKLYISRARYYYSEANKGISMLTDDGSRATVRMMSRIYSGILDEIEKSNYDIFSQRHYVSTFKKVITTFKIISGKINPVLKRQHKHSKIKTDINHLQEEV